MGPYCNQVGIIDRTRGGFWVPIFLKCPVTLERRRLPSPADSDLVQFCLLRVVGPTLCTSSPAGVQGREELPRWPEALRLLRRDQVLGVCVLRFGA